MSGRVATATDEGTPGGPDFEGASAWARALLAAKLDAHLTYHSVGHTADEVVPGAESIGRAEGLSEHDVMLVKTAAWFHDLGQVIQHPGHEAIGVAIANETLPRFGYTAEDVAAVGAAVMATRLPQTPTTHLGAVLADADLAVLGLPEFRSRHEDLREELGAAGQARSTRQWMQEQLAFLTAHTYLTATGRDRYDPGRAANIAWVNEQLADLEA